MMRWVFLIVTIVLLYGLTYLASQAIQWFVQPWRQLNFWVVAALCFVFSTAMMATLFLGLFRFAMGYLAMLWLGLLAGILAMGLIFVAKKVGLGDELMYRLMAVMCLVGVVGLSLYNAYAPTVRYLTIQINKPLPVPVRLAVASDLHLGAMVGKRQLDKLATLIADNDVDVLLVPGDVMDDDTVAFEAEQMAPHLAQVVRAARFGAMVSLGNHDLYRTQAYQDIVSAIVDSGAVLLNDEVATLTITKNGKQSVLGVIGRLDDHHADRKKTDELIKQLDSSLPVLLLDHRPTEIDKHVALPIDLQVSGHTHKGQIFPAGLIVNMLNRIGYGYEQINGSHFVVSSGYGFWGVPLRLGSQSEIWVIDVVGE